MLPRMQSLPACSQRHEHVPPQRRIAGSPGRAQNEFLAQKKAPAATVTRVVRKPPAAAAAAAAGSGAHDAARRAAAPSAAPAAGATPPAATTAAAGARMSETSTRGQPLSEPQLSQSAHRTSYPCGAKRRPQGGGHCRDAGAQHPGRHPGAPARHGRATCRASTWRQAATCSRPPGHGRSRRAPALPARHAPQGLQGVQRHRIASSWPPVFS